MPLLVRYGTVSLCRLVIGATLIAEGSASIKRTAKNERPLGRAMGSDAAEYITELTQQYKAIQSKPEKAISFLAHVLPFPATPACHSEARNIGFQPI